MTTYNRQLEGNLNDILTILGTTAPSLWPFWEKTGTLVTCIGVGDLTSAETGGAAEALEDDFSPLLMPCGLYAYHFHPTGDHHLAGIDHANYTFAAAAFSVGAWIRPNAIASNTVMAKYDSAGNLEEWRLWINGSGVLELELHDASASTKEVAASSAALTLSQMQFIVGTFDGTDATPTMWLYVNGAAVNDGSSTETGAFVSMENTAAPLTIGCSGVTATPVNEFHGRIAMPFVTGKALSATEVARLYAITGPMVGATLQ